MSLDDLIKSVEALCREHGFHWLLREAPETLGYFANITPVHTLPVVDKPSGRQGNPNWITFPSYGLTEVEALNRSFTKFKEYISAERLR